MEISEKSSVAKFKGQTFFESRNRGAVRPQINRGNSTPPDKSREQYTPR